MIRKVSWFVLLLSACTVAAAADDSYGPELQGFQYPYPVAQFEFMSQRQTLHMAYMDIHPNQANGATAVLLHGKNFWHDRRTVRRRIPRDRDGSDRLLQINQA